MKKIKKLIAHNVARSLDVSFVIHKAIEEQAKKNKQLHKIKEYSYKIEIDIEGQKSENKCKTTFLPTKELKFK